MRYKTFIFFLIVFVSFLANSQNLVQKELKRNTVFVEFGGNGILYSVNYNRLFYLSKKLCLSSRIGYGFTKNFNDNKLILNVIPVELTGLVPISKNKHFIEVGSGVTTVLMNYLDKFHKELILVLALRIGYRFQKPTGGLFFNVGFTPLYDFYVYNGDPNIGYHLWQPYAGMSIGYTF